MHTQYNNLTQLTTMLPTIILILAAVVLAALLQDNLKIPTPVSFLILAACSTGLTSHPMQPTKFDALVIASLPLLIAADALKLSVKELKQNALMLIILAVVIVALSVGFGVGISLTFDFFEDKMPVAAVVMLFCTVSATDPVTVSSVFSNFKVPHGLKLLTEGESLFNDATALIIFSLALLSLTGDVNLTPVMIAENAFITVAGAIGTGLLCGLLGYFLLKTTDAPFIEASILLLLAYCSYYTGEHFKFSGILSVIVSVLFANIAIEKAYEGKNLFKLDIKMFGRFPSSLHNMQIIHKAIDFGALICSAALFMSIGTLFNLQKALHYWQPAAILFVITTAIRAILMYKLSFFSSLTSKLLSVPRHWSQILTLAGSKGALSVLMVHVIPNEFTWKVAFEQIVIINIMLSILVYAPLLGLVIKLNKSKLEQDLLVE